MDPQVDRVLAEARARSIDVRGQIGSTGYCESYAVGDALVMRVPRSQFPATLARGEGPIVGAARGVDTPLLARTLLEASIDRQRTVDHGPLARFVDRLELAGVPVSLHERVIGHAPDRGDLPAIARALAELHDVFGYHGFLTPTHIVVNGERVTFVEPLPPYPRLLGAVGYALPIYAADPTAAHDEGMLLRDVAALVALAADAVELDLGWNADFVEVLETVAAGRLGRPWDPQPALRELYRRTQVIADTALRGWIDAAGRLVLAHYLPSPGLRPSSTAPRAPEPGTARTLLAHFDFHAALGGIAGRIARSPSLFDFIEMERANTIESFDRIDFAPAFNMRDDSFTQIANAVGELEQLYMTTFGTQPLQPLPPILHPGDVWAESFELRTILLDLDRLLAPTPSTLAVATSLFARVRTSIEALRDDAKRYMAARRYVNYVGRR